MKIYKSSYRNGVVLRMCALDPVHKSPVQHHWQGTNLGSVKRLHRFIRIMKVPGLGLIVPVMRYYDLLQYTFNFFSSGQGLISSFLNE